MVTPVPTMTRSCALALALIACDAPPTSPVGELDAGQRARTAGVDLDVVLGDCVPPTRGPWGGAAPHPLDGATITDLPYGDNAGLDDVWDAFYAGERDLAGSPIAVTGVHIINLGFRPDQGDLWLEDANHAMRTYLTAGEITAPVLPGDTVSFEVTALTDWFGAPEITGITNFTVDTTGGPVRVQNGIGRAPLDFVAEGYKNFEVFGEVSRVLGSCAGGTRTCYLLRHGGVDTPFDLSPAAGELNVGDCVHLIAPLGSQDGLARYQLHNWDWWRPSP